MRDEPFASVIQEGLEGFLIGRFGSQAEVQRFFEAHPVFAKDRNGKVHPQRITDLMTRPVYAGLIENPAWGVSLRQGHHEPIISAETYNRIQDRQAGVTKIAARADIHRDFVLRGAVCCGDCGAPYRSAWSKGAKKKYAYYVCQTKSCDSYGESIPCDKLEGIFEDLLRKLTPTQDLFRVARDMFKKIWDGKGTQTHQQKRALKEQITEAGEQ